ncbi:MAG TPA: hypothetical protein VI168_03445 [Croceibacterium sp.]
MSRILIALFGIAAIAAAPPPPEPPKPKAEVIERNEKGQATKIRVDGQVYEVCLDGKTDGCINPRDAGLDFGSVPLDHWPGRPASEGK